MKPEFKNISNKKINMDALNLFESKFKIILSDSYKQFLLNENGCFISSKYIFHMHTNNIEFCIQTVEIYDFKRLNDILKINIKNKNKEDFIGYLLLKNNMINIGESNLGFELCLSYSKENFGKIYYLDDPHDDEFVFLANSFDEFINGFELCPEELL